MRCVPAVALVLVVALGGCFVKKSTHQAKVAELQGEIADRDQRITTLEGDLQKIRGDLGEQALAKEATEAELAELRAMREADQKRIAAYEDLQRRFKELVDAGDLEVTFRKGQMRLKLPSGILFPSGSADLSERGQKTLAKVSKVLAELADRRFLVAGHTDNVPIKTDQFANNWYLSTARAVSVVEFMIAQGFPPERLAAAGYADKDPVAKNKTAKGRQRNRRIEIIVVPDLSELPKLAREPK